MKLHKVILITSSIFLLGFGSIGSFNIDDSHVNASVVSKNEVENIVSNKTWHTKLYHNKKSGGFSYYKYQFNGQLPITEVSIVSTFYNSKKKEISETNSSGDPGYKSSIYKKIGHNLYSIKVNVASGKPYRTTIRIINSHKIRVKVSGDKYVKGYHTYYAK